MASTTCNLAHGPISRQLLRFSIPIFLSNLLQQTYNAVDSAILGWAVDSATMAAAGSVGSLFNLLVGLSLGLATGINILAAIAYGAGDMRQLRSLIFHALFLSALSALLVSFVGVAFSSPLLHMIHTPEALMTDSRIYLRILSSGVIATILYNVGAGILQAQGDSLRPLISLAIGGVANVLLDILFVAHFSMGIAGAALATVLAQSIAAGLVLFRLAVLDRRNAPHTKERFLDRQILRRILHQSLPCGIHSSMFNISNLLAQTQINSLGTVIMAGYTAYGKIDTFVYMPIFAFSAAVSTFVGQNKGAGNLHRIRRGIWTGLLLTIGTTAFLASIVLGFTEPLMRLFTDDAVSLSFGIHMARYLMPFVSIYSISDILGSAIRGFGQSVPVMLISIACICLFRVAWLKGMFSLFHETWVIFSCYPISWTLCASVVTWYYFRHSLVYQAIQKIPKQSDTAIT